MTAPPGYARAEPEAPGLRPATLLGAQAVLTASLLVASARELLMRLPQLYLGPLDLGTSARFFGLALGVGLGAVVARRRAPHVETAIWSLAAVSALTSTAPLVWSLAFADAARISWLAQITMATSGALLGFAAMSAVAWLAPHARALGLVLALLSPLAVSVAALSAALALGAATQLPPGQAGAAVGLSLALLCAAAVSLERYLTRQRPSFPSRFAAPLGGLALAALVFARAEMTLPHAEVRGYGGDVLALTGARQRVALVSHRSHFELYADRMLKLSSVDAHRYAEALVHPALAAARQHRRVLLLGGGTGVVERELLRWSGVDELTVVVTDRALVDLARRSPWLFDASAGALDDARVRIVEAEPIVWLTRNTERFDAIVADIEDPIGYRQSKHFTRHGLTLVAASLADGGVASLQAPSPLTYPRAFASIGATLAAAGLDAVPYHAAVPTIGDAGFFLLAAAGGAELRDRAAAGARRLPRGTRFVTPGAIPSLFHFPADLRPALASEAPNTLHTQPLVELYAEEHERQPER